MNQGFIRSLECRFDCLHRLIDSMLIILMLMFAVAVYSKSWSDKYTIAAFGAVMLFSLSAGSNKLYQSYRVSSLMAELRPLFVSWAMTVSGLLLIGYAFNGHSAAKIDAIR